MATSGFSPFNLGPRLTLIFATLIALILGGNALVVLQFRIVRNETNRLTGANQQLAAVLGLQANLLSFHRRLDDLARSMDVSRLVTEAASLRGTLQEQTQQTRTAIANLPVGTVVDPSFLPTLDTVDVILPSEIDAIHELAKSGDWGAIQPRVGNELNPIETQTAILVNSINQQASEELRRGVAKMSSVQRRILIIVPATALATFFIAAFFGWSIAQRFIELRLDERVAERTRIARELHDTLLQSFHGVMMMFQTLSDELPETTKQKFDRTIRLAAQAITEGRDAVQGLRSTTVVTNDLAAALRCLAEGLATDESNQNSPLFNVTVEGVSRDLHPIMRDEVYRISGEALRNAFLHAQAQRIDVEIRYDPRRLRLRIRDDGKGIEPQVLEKEGRAGHWGLRGMRERAQQIGGKLDVWSEVNSGTDVELSIPARIAYLKPA